MTRMGGPYLIMSVDVEKTLFVLLLIVGLACAGIGTTWPVTGGWTEPVTGGLTEPVTGGLTEPVTGGLTEPVTGGLTEPATTINPIRVDCCFDVECDQAIGRSYCDVFFDRSDTRNCTNPELLWPRKKRSVAEGNFEMTTNYLERDNPFPGGICRCVSDHELRDGYCRVKPVECCSDTDCRWSHGRESFCSITEYGNSPCTNDDYDDDNFVFPRKKREVGESEQTTDKGFCECNEGYIYKYSMCRSLEVMKECCLDDDCDFYFGANSVCGDPQVVDTSKVCFSFEFPKRKKREVDMSTTSPPPREFQGKCTCVPGFTLVVDRCVPTTDPMQCCSDKECVENFGENSYCGDDPMQCCSDQECVGNFGESSYCGDGMNEEIVCPERRKRDAHSEGTTLRPFAGRCTCLPGYSMTNEGCVPNQLICCTHAYCYESTGVNSYCRTGVGVVNDVCINDNNPIDPRKRREIDVTPDPSLPNQNNVGICTCTILYTLQNLTCVLPPETTTVSSTESTTTDPGVSTTSTAVDQTSTNPDQTSTNPDQTSQNPDSSTAFSCYNLNCTGEDCSARLAAETDETNSCLSPSLQCFTVKRCLASGVSYEFGCTDPCVVGSDPIPAGCYSVICNQDRLCNNDTSHTDSFECQPSSAAMILMNIRIFSSIILFRHFL